MAQKQIEQLYQKALVSDTGYAKQGKYEMVYNKDMLHNTLTLKHYGTVILELSNSRFSYSSFKKATITKKYAQSTSDIQAMNSLMEVLGMPQRYSRKNGQLQVKSI